MSKKDKKEEEVRDGVPDFFVNSIGRTIFCNPIPHDYIAGLFKATEQEFRKRNEPIDPPTYEFEAEGGVTMAAFHDETTLQTDEDKAAWQAYQEAVMRLAQDQEERTLKALAFKGIRLDWSEPAWKQEFEEWAAEEEFIGGLSGGLMERRYQFIRARLLITIVDLPGSETASDKSKCAETCGLLAYRGATREQVSAMRDLFRRSVGGAGAGTGATGGAGTKEG